MPHVSLAIADKNYPCRSLEGVERLGVLDTGVGGRIIPGVAMSVTAVATSQASAARVYRVRLTSVFAVMALRRRSRIFQHLSIPDIVRKVVEEGAYSSSNIRDMRAPGCSTAEVAGFLSVTALDLASVAANAPKRGAEAPGARLATASRTGIGRVGGDANDVLRGLGGFGDLGGLGGLQQQRRQNAEQRQQRVGRVDHERG